MIPKIYRFNQKKLTHEKVSKLKIVLSYLLVLFLGISVSFVISAFKTEHQLLPDYEELVILIDDKENEMMSPKAIYEYMKEVGIKYPEIVWSQAVLESRFSSPVCRENHNFFGMKLANRRPNVQTGENLNHATYRNWKMSVLDYAIWQTSTGVWKLKSESEYYSYLSGSYAEDPNYIYKVKNIRDNFDKYLEEYEEKFKKGEL